jgi:hypothetical protein
LHLEARNNGGFPFGKFFFLFTQGSFSGMKSVSKIFNTRSIFFSFFCKLSRWLCVSFLVRWRASQQDATPLDKKRDQVIRKTNNNKAIYTIETYSSGSQLRHGTR